MDARWASIGILGLLLAGTAAVSATMIDEAAIVVRGPHIGDRASYDVSANGRTQQVEVLRLPATSFVNRQGDRHAADALQVTTEEGTTVWITSRSTHALLATVVGPRQGDGVRQIQFAGPSDAAHCLAGLQQVRLTRNGPSGLGMPCRLDLPAGGTTTIRTSSGNVEDLQHGLVSWRDGSNSVAWDLDSSWPATLSLASPAGPLEWTRLDDVRGNTVPPAAAAVVPAPALRSSIPVPWRADDLGVSHPFRLSTAYTWASMDPVFAEFQAWNRSQASTAVVHAALSTMPVDGAASLQWTIVVQGDDSFAMVQPQATILGTSLVPTWRPSTTILDPIRQTTITAGEWRPGSRTIGDDPLPELGGLQQRWQQAFGLVPVTDWTLDPDCRARCDDAATLIRLNFEESDWHAMTGSVRPGRPGIHRATLTFHDDGSLRNATVDGDPTALFPEASPSAVQTYAAAGVGFGFELGAREGAAAMGLLGVVLVAWALLRKVGAIVLFARKAGEPRGRLKILAMVKARPGIHFAALVRDSGLSNGTVDYHLDVLRKRGTIRAETHGAYTCYFAIETMSPGPSMLAPTKAAGAQAILAELLATTASSKAGLARATGLACSTVAYHITHMEMAGLVEGSGKALRLTAQGLAIAAGLRR